jgi:hypothetical protein
MGRLATAAGACSFDDHLGPTVFGSAGDLSFCPGHFKILSLFDLLLDYHNVMPT